jgi:hypothetical protein
MRDIHEGFVVGYINIYVDQVMKDNLVGYYVMCVINVINWLDFV